MVNCAFLEHNHAVDPADEVGAYIPRETSRGLRKVCGRLGNNLMKLTPFPPYFSAQITIEPNTRTLKSPGILHGVEEESLSRSHFTICC